jgi:hypothetical protein
MPDIEKSTAATEHAAERKLAIEELYVQNYPFIQELAFSDPHMTLEGEQQITEGIAKYLADYDGKLTHAEFRLWLAEIIAPVVGFHAIKRVSEPFVRSAIWRTLGHSSEPNRLDDYSELVRELEQEVWLWTYLHLDELTKPGTAKITTRLYERAVVMTRAWLKKQRGRRAATIRHIFDLPTKAASKRIAAELDREEREKAEQKTESKEIQDEMKIMGMVA